MVLQTWSSKTGQMILGDIGPDDAACGGAGLAALSPELGS